MIKYNIIEHSILTGVFSKKEDRDSAFKEFFMKINRSGFKTTTEE